MTSRAIRVFGTPRLSLKTSSNNGKKLGVTSLVSSKQAATTAKGLEELLQKYTFHLAI